MYNYQADFSNCHITAAIAMKKNIMLKKLENGQMKCHLFSLRKENENPDYAHRSLSSGKQITQPWLYGPASRRDGSIIYSCKFFKCSIPCPCSNCRLNGSKCLNKNKQISCECDHCYEELKEHELFHNFLHSSCKFCNQLLNLFPAFNNLRYRFIHHGHTMKSTNFEHFYRVINKDKVLKCEECDHEFTTKHNLQKHIDSVHSKESFKCEHCGKHFSRKDNLLRHKDEVHTKDNFEEVYKCNDCQKTFSRKSQLDRHLKSSVDEDNYYINQCEICDQEFCTKLKLLQHKRSTHNELKCDECKRTFSALRDAKKHNIDRKVCSCEVCCERFCNSRDLAIHKNSNHSN